MNSIRRGRKRPRVESVNWKTFGWLLRREAALAVAACRPPHGNDQYPWRRWISGRTDRELRALVEYVLSRHPEMRFTA